MPTTCVVPLRQLFCNSLTPCNINTIEQINTLQNAIGYIAYECYNEIEHIVTPLQNSFCNFPRLHFSTISNNNIWHERNQWQTDIPKVKWVKSNFSDETYVQAINKILYYIKKGTCYQVNLTRKFYGEFEAVPSAVSIFNKLYSISPNPYAMLYKIDDERAIISSSPECFIKRAGNIIESVPIKGTVGSHLPQSALYNAKDRSENLMITDLVRNDIGRISTKVWVENFQNIHTFGQVHHMSSKVCGNLSDGISNANCVSATFPPGSMTGAPKIKAIQIAHELENMPRGVYSGCMGIVENAHNFNLAVTIRTILVEGKKFEFQAGGAIVWDSVPSSELAEVNLKIKPILETLNMQNGH